MSAVVGFGTGRSAEGDARSGVGGGVDAASTPSVNTAHVSASDVSAGIPEGGIHKAGVHKTGVHYSGGTNIADAPHRGRQPIARAVYGDLIQFAEFILIVLLSVGIAYFYHIEVLIVDFDAQLYTSAGIIGATGVTALLRRDGYYEFGRLIASGSSVRAVLSRWMMVILGLIAFAFTLKISDAFSRFWLFTWAATACLSMMVVRVGAAYYLRQAARAGGVFGRRVAVIGDADCADRFVEQVKASDAAITIVGVFPHDCAADDPAADDRTFQSLESMARAGALEDIIVAAPTTAHSEALSVLTERLSSLPVSIAIAAATSWMDHLGGEMVRIGGAPALTLYRRPLEGWGGFLKTIEDCVLGLVLFIVASPILAACAIALRLQGQGPILFVQKRHGFNNEVFRIYKFRTMTVAEDGDVVRQATAGDARVTKVGAFLRKWSLDELPQLINVLKGEMSLVGPRPHALAHNDAYAKTIENYSGRHKVKPGITGWAQVNGYRGETSETHQMESRFRYDLQYIDNWSLWFDAKILVMTVRAVLFPENAH
ncbi:MAG: undecaprenyl-phosphate glucose phosphotransferase [Pseudomonadota bacterium]